MTTAFFCENDHRWDTPENGQMKDQVCPECGQPAYRCLNLDNVRKLNQSTENVFCPSE